MAFLAGTPYSGTRGRVQVNGIAVPLDHWDVELGQDVDDTTTFEDFHTDGETYQVDVPGVKRATGTISGYWNSANNNMAAGGGGLSPGALVSNLNCYVDRIGNRGIFFGYARITSVPIACDVGGGKIKFTAKFKNYGPWTNIV